MIETFQRAWKPASAYVAVSAVAGRTRSRSFPVIGPDRQLVGMISREDVIRALQEATQDG